jgi:HD superfamily phosphohydrolase
MRGKVVNDPVYGFIPIPHGIVFDVMQHPYVQRLRRISQVGLSVYVYPGATHTRFHHALGALYLMQEAVASLRNKGVAISADEAEAAQLAILLHDVGHGPFSHALEHTLLPVHHEVLTRRIMDLLNEQMHGKLDLAIAIFEDSYDRPFLHQLISGQLDMDRLDYLMRDSFYTGVIEGVVGHDRIIKMLDVHNNRLVVEDKGIYSIERFLHARRLMYWQVYLHKTVLAAEHMLIQTLSVAKYLFRQGYPLEVHPRLRYFMEIGEQGIIDINDIDVLERYCKLDDVDVMHAIKDWASDKHPVLSYLANGLLNRRLFRIRLNSEPFSEKILQTEKELAIKHFGSTYEGFIRFLVQTGKETTRLYDHTRDEIVLIDKEMNQRLLSNYEEINLTLRIENKFYLFSPKFK